MSDLFMYELQDNVWDEFSETDDHIVPCDGDDYTNLAVHEGDKRKKARHEVIDVSSNADDSNTFNTQSKGESSIHNQAEKDRMLEKGSWSHASDGVFPSSCDGGSVKEAASEETKTSSNLLKNENTGAVGSEFSAVDPVLSEKCASVDNDTYDFPLSNISKEDDLSFLDNVQNDKADSDLLYCDWPDDLGNFGDVDGMFRSCDDSFGLGNLGNEDDFGWFSSCQATEGTEDASLWGSKFSISEANVLDSASEHHDASNLKGVDSTSDDYVTKNQVLNGKTGSRIGASTDCTSNSHLLSPNGSDTKPVISQKRQVKQNHSDGKRMDRVLENGGSLYNSNGMKQIGGRKQSYGDPNQEKRFPSPGLQQYKQNMESSSLGYMQNHLPYMHIGYNHSLNQTSVFPCNSGRQSENNGYPSSAKEPSYTSNQVQSMESSHTAFETPITAINKQCEKPFHVQDLKISAGKNFNCSSIASPKAFYDPVSAQKQINQFGYEIDSHSETGVSVGVPMELDSSNVQESSCISSVVDDISLEATSFRQLQQVMEQLDIRTKLCIRDSLYRLAKSAEQRHNSVNSDEGKREDGDTEDPLMTEETNKSTVFMDMETDTNPIDRSIAHLLFHRPSDPSIVNANDISSAKSQALMHGPVSEASAVTQDNIGQEETAIASDKTLLTKEEKQ